MKDLFHRLRQSLFNLNTGTFEALALEIYHIQAQYNPIYSTYIKTLRRSSRIQKLAEIPFLPISFFKNAEVRTGDWQSEACFLSSGTTQATRSQHFIDDLNFYYHLSTYIYEQAHSRLTTQTIHTFLPKYRMQPCSSLIYMLDNFMKQAHPTSRHISEIEVLCKISKDTTPVLWTTTYGVADILNSNMSSLKNYRIIETGGVKKGEKVAQPLSHKKYREKDVSCVYSEYGMTELCSQIYSHANRQFFPPPWVKVRVRSLQDPFTFCKTGELGALNIIDLANVHSCAFIETEDLGIMYENGAFTLHGRMPQAQQRGCYVMYTG